MHVDISVGVTFLLPIIWSKGNTFKILQPRRLQLQLFGLNSAQELCRHEGLKLLEMCLSWPAATLAEMEFCLRL